MIIYIIVFSLSLIFIYFGYGKNSRNIRKRYIVISALLLIVMASLRDKTVGLDTSWYQVQWLDMAKRSSSFQNFLQLNQMSRQPLELGYLILTYMASKMGSYPVVFFLNESVIVLFVYLSIYELRNEVSPTFALFVYLFSFYCYGLNTVRQCMGMSVVMYMITQWRKQKYVLSIMLLVLAIGFHTSALIGVIMIVIYEFSKICRTRLVLFGTMALAVALSIWYRHLFSFLVLHIPFIPDRYIVYFDVAIGQDVIQISRLAYSILCVLIAIFIYERSLVARGGIGDIIIDNTEAEGMLELSGFRISDAYFLYFMMVGGFLGATIGGRESFMQRIFFYFQEFSIFTMPMGLDIMRDDFFNKMTGRFLLILFLCSYWYFNEIYRNSNGVFPYIFA